MTVIEKLAKEKYGSVRKMFLANNIKGGTVYPVLAGYRKPWPKLRARLAELVGANEQDIFTSDGWIRKAEGVGTGEHTHIN